jgi:hypothetical protein
VRIGGIVATGLLLITGSAWGREVVPERFHVVLEVAVQTEGVDPDLASTFAPLRWTVDAMLSMDPVRRFRDGSIGWLIRFDKVTEFIHDDEGAKPVPISGLEGRTVELRAFEDGEVLDVDMGAHIAGWGRGGDVLDVLLPVLSPAPPEMGWGKTGTRRMIWPFRIGREARWDNAVAAEWRNSGPIKDLAGPVRRYHYSGPWTLRGSDRRKPPGLRFSGTGELSGTVDVTFRDGRVLRHEFSGIRRVEIVRQAGDPIRQEQRFTGKLERSQP